MISGVSQKYQVGKRKKKAMKSGELSAMVDNIHGSVKGVSNSIFSGKSSKRRSLLG